MNLVLIHPDGLRAVWPHIKTGLEEMPAEDWIAEDVYHAIRAGESALYLAVGDAGYAGFMVLRKITSEFSKSITLHVWLAHNVGADDVIEAGLGVIKNTAQQLGATKITFGSPRKGWSKRFPISSINYEIPL